MIEHDPTTGTVRVDDDGLADLLAGSAEAPPPVREALPTLADPLVTLDLVVAGATARQHHRLWVDAERAVVLARVHGELSQLLVLPTDHVAAALTRLSRVRPRRTTRREERPCDAGLIEALVAVDEARRATALAAVGAAVAWRLEVGWAGDTRRLHGTDGPEGCHLADPERDALLPTSPSVVYRLFASALPPAALAG